MGCLILFILSPLVAAWGGLMVATSLGTLIARSLHGAEGVESFRDRILGLLGMGSPVLVLVAMVHGVDGAPLGVLAAACLAGFIAGFGLLYRRMKLDFSP